LRGCWHRCSFLRRSPSVGGTLFTARTRVSKRLQCYEWICNSGGYLPLLESAWCLPVLALVRKGGGEWASNPPRVHSARAAAGRRRLNRRGGGAGGPHVHRLPRGDALPAGPAPACACRWLCNEAGALLPKPCRHRGSHAHTHASACTHMRARTYHPDVRPSLGSMLLADVLSYA
jgi:hypothetical protein